MTTSMTTPRLATSVTTWAELAGVCSRCVACPDLVAGRTQVVAGVYPLGARALLVGEAPGAQEDRAGEPFVGRSGRLLTELLDEVGLGRDRVAITNVVKCRPPGNRKPTRTEVATCSAWLERQIELIDPAVICALGGTAAEWAVRRPGVRISQARAQMWKRDGRAVVVTYHPAAAMRFGPNGGPRAGLREDLATVAELVGVDG